MKLGLALLGRKAPTMYRRILIVLLVLVLSAAVVQPAAAAERSSAKSLIAALWSWIVDGSTTNSGPGTDPNSLGASTQAVPEPPAETDVGASADPDGLHLAPAPSLDSDH